MSNWISVKDRLPRGANGMDISEIAIIFTATGQVTTGWINGDWWYLIDGGNDYHTKHSKDYVTHWMPLPEPPSCE